MQFILIIIFLTYPFAATCQNEPAIRDLKRGKFPEDSSFIYRLPFEPGKQVFLIQAYQSCFSHKNELALDFKVRKGTKICAARAGVVIHLFENSDKGGLKKENLYDGNFIAIRHADSSIAYYWHLQKSGALKNIGDSVQAGELIRLSGNTGYSAFPHLHFEVQQTDANGCRKQLATRFKTRRGVRYLRPGRFYKVVNLN